LRIRDGYPASRISDPTTAPKERGKNFFYPTKYHKIVNNFIFEHKKFFKSQNTKPKFVIKLSKIWVWDPDSEKPYSEIRIKKAPDPRIQGQKGIGSHIRIRNTG
jgi:hypothetical protein